MEAIQEKESAGDAATELQLLAEHLARGGRVTSDAALWLIDEVMSFLSETAEQFVCRRHSELQHAGCSNPEIYERIRAELPRRRFIATPLSARQIRRMVYG